MLFVVGGEDIADADRLPPCPFGNLQLCQLWRADFLVVKVFHKEGTADPVNLLALVDPTAVFVESIHAAGLASNGIVEHKTVVAVRLQREGSADACKFKFGDVCAVEPVHGIHPLKLRFPIEGLYGGRAALVATVVCADGVNVVAPEAVLGGGFLKVVVRFAAALWLWVLRLCQEGAGAVAHAVAFAAAVTDWGIKHTLSYKDAFVP